MGIVSVKRKHGSKRGPLIAPDGGLAYSEEWIVISNIATEKGKDVIKAQGLPKINNAYSEDGRVVCTRLEPTQDSEQEKVWHVTVEYGFKGAEWGSGDINITLHPLARPPRMSLGTAKFTESARRDLDGKVFQDTAGTPFRTPPVIPRSHLVLSFTKNVAAVDTQFLDSYEDAVNTDVFRGHPPMTCRMNDISAAEAHEQGFSFFQVTYQIELNFKKWIPLKTECIGPRHRDVARGDVMVNHDDKGVADGSLQFLDKQGVVIPRGDVFIFDLAHQQEWRVYKKKAFAPLGIG